MSKKRKAYKEKMTMNKSYFKSMSTIFRYSRVLPINIDALKFH